MYIDIHTHVGFYKIYSFPYIAGMLEDDKIDIPQTKLEYFLKTFLADRSCSRHLKQMELSGIDRSVLLIIDSGIGMKEPEMTIEEIYELHHQIIAEHKEKYIVFAGIDPRRGKSGFDLFKKGIFDYGFKGLKLYPPMGYKMDDDQLSQYYKICDEFQLPVLIHTGPSLAILHNEYASPINALNVCRKFPNVKFIFAHAGLMLENEDVLALLNMPNTFVDISGFQKSIHKATQSNFFKRIFHNDVNEKILYGSDWPLFNMMRPLKDDISVLKETSDGLIGNDNYKPDGFENIMYKNARRLLKL